MLQIANTTPGVSQLPGADALRLHQSRLPAVFDCSSPPAVAPPSPALLSPGRRETGPGRAEEIPPGKILLWEVPVLEAQTGLHSNKQESCLRVKARVDVRTCFRKHQQVPLMNSSVWTRTPSFCQAPHVKGKKIFSYCSVSCYIALCETITGYCLMYCPLSPKCTFQCSI